MRRLNPARLGDERGAVTIVVALLMVVMIGFAAISIDVGRLYAERRELQNGADAAALGLACDPGAAGSMTDSATRFVQANSSDGLGYASAGLEDDGVLIEAESRGADGAAELDLTFAPVIGVDRVSVGAESYAVCQYLESANTGLPLAFSRCAFNLQTNGGTPSGTQEYTLILPKKDDTGCTGTSGNPVPGGFGWLQTDGAGCKVNSSIGDELISNPGNRPSCDNVLVEQVANTKIVLPIYDDIGANGGFVVSGYAAFYLTGYYFAGQYRYNSPCSGSERCIRGYFTTLLDTDDPSFVYSDTAPDYGVSQPRLREIEEPPL